MTGLRKKPRNRLDGATEKSIFLPSPIGLRAFSRVAAGLAAIFSLIILVFAACDNPVGVNQADGSLADGGQGDNPAANIVYIVSYDKGGGGGTAPASQTVFAGTVITIPEPGDMTGPKGKPNFAGWEAIGRSIIWSPSAQYPVNGDTAFVAQWTAALYTVSYNAGDGGGNPPAPHNATAGTRVTLPGQGEMTAPADKPYFAGWDDGAARRNAGASYPVTGDAALTAQWTDILYTVSYSAGDGGGNPPAPQDAAAETSITLPGQEGMTAPGGKSFTGWNDGATTYRPGASYPVTGDAALTAQWTDDLYTVRYNAGTGGGNPPVSQYVNAGISITLPGQGSMTAPARKGFTGWNDGETTYNAGDSYTVYGNAAFTAQWTDILYTVSYSAGDGGDNPPDPQNAAAGTIITLPGQGGMTAPAHKSLTGWYDGATTYHPGDSYRVTGDTTLAAQWTDNRYTVTFGKGTGGGTAPARQTGTAGTSITLPGQGSMTAPAHQHFTGWHDGATTHSAGDSYTINGDVAFTAQWTDILYTVSYSAGEGDNPPASQTGIFGTSITLPGQGDMTAPLDKPHFDGWHDGAARRNAGASYLVTDDAALTAQWIDVAAYLAAAPGGRSAGDPVPLTVQFALGTMTEAGSGWRVLLAAIESAGKYTALDLSACGMTGTEFAPDDTVDTGKARIVSLVLPAAAASIGAGRDNDDDLSSGLFIAAFRHFNALTTVSGANITSIGYAAFAGCTALTEVSFPAAATIGDSAFYGCTGLTEVSLPKAATIGDNAFQGCTGLTEVSLPEAETISFAAFCGCTGLTSVSIPKAATIKGSAFQDCTSLASLSLPAAAAIGSSTFYRCTGLTSLSLPKAETIGSGAFGSTGDAALTITLGAAAPAVGIYIFDQVTAAKTVTVRTPSGATGYGTAPAGTNANNWANAFRGRGWDGNAYGNGTVNGNITVQFASSP
jgi:hypothetical protein